MAGCVVLIECNYILKNESLQHISPIGDDDATVILVQLFSAKKTCIDAFVYIAHPCTPNSSNLLFVVSDFSLLFVDCVVPSHEGANSLAYGYCFSFSLSSTHLVVLQQEKYYNASTGRTDHWDAVDLLLLGCNSNRLSLSRWDRALRCHRPSSRREYDGLCSPESDCKGRAHQAVGQSILFCRASQPRVSLLCCCCSQKRVTNTHIAACWSLAPSAGAGGALAVPPTAVASCCHG